MRVAELLDLHVASDKTSQASRRRGLQPRAHRSRAGDLIDLDRSAHPLDVDRPHGRDLDIALGQTQRFGRHQDRARSRQLLHPGRQVRRLPDRGVIHAEIAADRPHNNFACVQADANLDRHALGAPDVSRVPLHGLVHPQRRVTRSHRVVLVGERRAEERHDAVAHHLVDGALVVMDGVHHQREDGIENLTRLFGIAVGKQLHRALEVGEEDRDLLALALEGGLGGEDLLGKMLRGVRLRGRRTNRGRCASGDSVAALKAEAGAPR